MIDSGLYWRRVLLFGLVLNVFSLSGTDFGPVSAHAHDRLTEAEIQAYKADGTYDERVGRTLILQQNRLSEGLRQRGLYKVRRAALEASGLTPAQAAQSLGAGPLMAFPFTAQPELRSTGTVKTLTILIDFKDNLATVKLPGMTAATFEQNIYGPGTAHAQMAVPFDSVHNYYHRASQGKVDLQGTVLGWHHFSKDRKDYEPARAPLSLPPQARAEEQARLDNAAIFSMVSEAMMAADSAQDFAQFDNDNDGDIDLVTILYSGDPGSWGSFWWAYRWEFFTSAALTKTFDGKRAKQFVFQFVSKRGSGGADFDPTTLMHEMGHAFGLADYYDYDADIGPEGGVGGLDMMDANQGNQNAFSRWLLDWIKPTVIGSGGPATKTLTASGSTNSTNKAIAIFPGLASGPAPSQEMLIVENRHKIGNDAKMPDDGLLIWHIDASLNSDESDFANDNSYTNRKLIRLVRADNANDFGSNDSAGAATYFKSGKALTPSSTPSSNGYDGFVTNISIDSISAAGEFLTVKVGFLGAPAPTPSPAPPPAAVAGSAPMPAPMPQEGLEATVQRLVQSPPETPVDLDAFEDLDRRFAAATSDELKTIWGKLDRKRPPSGKVSDSSLTLKLLLSHWASKDGANAVQALREQGDEDPFVREAFSQMMAAWAHQSPVQAAEWYLNTENEALRASKKLEAGNAFAHESFEFLFIADPDRAIAGLEKLKHTSEIVGAVEGLRHATDRSRKGAADLKEALKNVRTNTQIIQAADSYFSSLEDAKNASLQIEDAAERSKFREVFQKSHRH